MGLAADEKPARPAWAVPLAPFSVRSFRFQWPADLLTSWAYEMETLILGWYVLTTTESVLLLTLFGALGYLGTLLAPMFGVFGDRIGRRKTLCAMRAFLAVVASIIMILAQTGYLTPAWVFPLSFLTGLVRPSDLVMRNALIGDTMPPARLMNALGLSRTTMDTARIMGALAGAGLYAALGIASAYVAVTTFYVLSFTLTLGVSRVHHPHAPDTRAPVGVIRSQLRDLKDGFANLKEPGVIGLMLLAVVVNFSAFPLAQNLLPYVAREIYGIDATGLSHLSAAFASGALTGSIVMALSGWGYSARFMIANLLIWYAMLAVFAQMETKHAGLIALYVMGVFQSMGMISMSGLLLQNVTHQFRARVMGIRMLCVYALPFGLLGTGPLIQRFGYPTTVSLYVAFGAAAVALIGWRWRGTISR